MHMAVASFFSREQYCRQGGSVVFIQAHDKLCSYGWRRIQAAKPK
jgi:hypothetical protein